MSSFEGQLKWLLLIVVLMLGTSIAWISIVNEPKTESENPSSSGFTDKWCLRAVGEQNWKELGYLKGDILDELVCREDLTALVDEKIVTTANPELRQALIELGIIED